MKNNLIISVIVALVIGGAAGFFGGMQYQKSKTVDFVAGRFGGAGGNGQSRQFGGAPGGQTGQGGQRGMMAGISPVSGEIIGKDDKSITVKMDDGSSKIVFISSTTTINKSSEGTMADLKTGEKVAAFGTQGSDGSVTAQNVQLNPQVRMFGRPSASPTK